jgi:hypothetical protein
MWQCKDDKAEYYTLISYRKNGTGCIMDVGLDDSGAIDSGRQDFFVTRTSKCNYLNQSNTLLIIDGKVHHDHPGTYTFTKYRFSWLGQLVTAGTKVDAFVTAVQSGKLKGRLTRDNNGNVIDVLLTDSSDHILHFIESSKAGDIFDAESRFTKVGEK